MLSYHNDPAVKSKYVERFAHHRELDAVIQGTGYDNGRGCFVGCCLQKYDHELFPVELGWPIWLARLADGIFEGLPKSEAAQFGADLLEAVPVGVDLELVRYKIAIPRHDRLIAILQPLLGKHGEPIDVVINGSITAISNVSKVFQDVLINDAATRATDAAWDAAWAADADADAAWDAAWAADAAADAARAATRATDAAADAARAATRATDADADAAWDAAWAADAAADAARAAAWAADADAAWDAAWDAAADAAWDAAWAAAWAADADAAWDAAWAAARAAARAAAWAAARAAARAASYQAERDTLLTVLREMK